MTTSTLPRSICSRDNYLNVSDFSTQGVIVSSSAQGVAAPSPLHLGVFCNQIPPLPNFSEEMDSGKGDSKSFTDWKERFEMVAEACHWDEHTKLVKLVTTLCGQAYFFYRSCDRSQWSNYMRLIEHLT